MFPLILTALRTPCYNPCYVGIRGTSQGWFRGGPRLFGVWVLCLGFLGFRV